jgi:hypothetical protein
MTGDAPATWAVARALSLALAAAALLAGLPGAAFAGAADSTAVVVDTLAAPALRLPPAPALRAPPDSVHVHFELGASADASNEQFYEQTYTDTTFLGRQLHGTPQGSAAGVAAMELSGLRDAGRMSYALRPELALGDLVTRAGATGALGLRAGEHWRTLFEPRVQFSRDRSFGIERREMLAASTATARRRFDDGADALELRLGGELLGTHGSSDPFLLSHRNLRLGAGWDHDGLLGLGWGANYRIDVRTFPDSTNRDHIEHDGEISLRRDFLGGHSLSFVAGATRRIPRHDVPGSRDHFFEARGELLGSLHFSDQYAGELLIEADGYRYDRPDSAVDFDYALTRMQMRVRRDFGGRAWLAFGPRVEILTAPWNAAERYVEVALPLELETLAAGHWWLLEPAAGTRAYELSESGNSKDPAAIHSSYLFLETEVLGEQPLPLRTRARLTMSARFEQHDDPSQDSRSLYFSLDVRRLF